MNRKFLVKRISRFFFFSAISSVLLSSFFSAVDASGEPNSAQQTVKPEDIPSETIKLNAVELKPIGIEAIDIETVNVKATDLKTAGIKISPKEVLQGEIYQEKGDYKKAEELYLQAIKKYPGAYGAQRAKEYLVLLYLETKNFPAAEKTLSEISSEEMCFATVCSCWPKGTSTRRTTSKPSNCGTNCSTDSRKTVLRMRPPTCLP